MSAQLQVTGEAKIRDIQGPVVANDGVVTALDGAASQYVRGDGTLADFPTSSGGGSSVSYYLNSSVSQGTIGGVAYRELSKDPIIGAGTDIAISANGYVANYITDVNDPDVVLVPGGNFNCEFYFSVNNNTGNPTTYAELYKYDGTTFTLLGTSAGVPESINQGTTIAPYYFAIPVATAALSVTDRLAIRIYVNVDGRTVTLHTENGHLCQVVTTLSKGMVSLNNLTDQSQYLATGTSGTNFAIVSSGDTHTFNLPVASATNTGKLSSTDWSTFNNKQNALTNPITGTGASGQVTFFNGTTSVIGSNNFFWDNTNSFLGVGTNVPSAGVTSFSTTPAFQFKAAGTAPAITFSNTLTSASLACVFGLATANNQFITGTAAGDMAIANQSTSAGAIVFGTGTTERMRMTSAGTLSIGNTNSTYKLDVTGIVRFTGELTGSSAVFSSTVRPASSFTSDLGTSSFRWNDIYGFSLTLTSSVTALSLIKSGGTSSQFLMADGSVNTSVLPSGAYLPLTGGTLTGALSLTYATPYLIFNATSGNSNNMSFNVGGTQVGLINISSSFFSFFNNTSSGYLFKNSAGTNVFTIADNGQASLSSTLGLGGALSGTSATFTNTSTFRATGNAYTNGSIILQSSTGATSTYLTNSGGIFYLSNNGSTDHLQIASNGTATFSSSVTVGDDINLSKASSPAIVSTTNQNIRLVTNGFTANLRTDGAFTTTTGLRTDGFVQAVNLAIGASYYNIAPPTNGAIIQGNVGIGVSSPTERLEILGPDGSGAAVRWRMAGGRKSGYLYSDSAGVAIYDTNLNDAGIYIAQNTQIDFRVNGSQRMLINSSGNVGIGTSSPLNLGSATNTVVTVNAATGNSAAYALTINNVEQGYISAQASSMAIVNSANTPMILATNNAERMRITSGGNVLIGTTTDSGARINARFASSGNPTISATNTNASNSRCYYGQKASGSTDDYYMIFDNAVDNKFLFYGNGGLGNVQGNNVNISDVRTKKEIFPLESYWDKIKAIEIVKFKYKDQTHDDFNIGVIAQQVEAVAPEFIEAEDWGKDTPTQTEEPLKSVYTTDLYHATIKVLQEAMAKIEQLEEKVKQLENK